MAKQKGYYDLTCEDIYLLQKVLSNKISNVIEEYLKANDIAFNGVVSKFEITERKSNLTNHGFFSRLYFTTLIDIPL